MTFFEFYYLNTSEFDAPIIIEIENTCPSTHATIITFTLCIAKWI